MRNLAWLVLAACGGTITGPDASIGDAATNGDALDEPSPASCTWPDANACKTGPAFVVCQDGGYGQWCVDTPCGSFAASSCTIECKPSEYGAVCGGGMASGDPPSSACRLVMGLPSGTAGYCCPCE